MFKKCVSDSVSKYLTKYVSKSVLRFAKDTVETFFYYMRHPSITLAIKVKSASLKLLHLVLSHPPSNNK